MTEAVEPPAAVRIRDAWQALPVGAHAATAVVAAVAAAGATGWWADTRLALATAGCLLVLLTAAVVDLVEHRLPNALVLVAAVPVLVGATLAALTGSAAWTGALAGAAVVGLPLLGAHLASPAGLGFGDVKAGAVLGAGVGLVSPALAVTGLMAGLLGTAGWAIVGRHRAVPLGPGMVAGAVIVFAAGRFSGVEPW